MVTKVASGIYTELTPRMVARVKRACRHASNNPHFWRSIVARPSTAVKFCERVEASVVNMLKSDPTYKDGDAD